MAVFVVVVGLEVGVVLLLLDLHVSLPVRSVRLRTNLTTSDEVGHGDRVIGRLFRISQFSLPIAGVIRLVC